MTGSNAIPLRLAIGHEDMAQQDLSPKRARYDEVEFEIEEYRGDDDPNLVPLNE